MNKRSAQVNQERASISTARKEDALELAQILYDIYIEQVKDEVNRITKTHSNTN